jgi:sporulation protein YunB
MGYIQLIPNLKSYGKLEIERFNQLIINHCYSTKESQYDNLVIIERDDNNDIQLIDFDMVKVNQLATDIVLDIENTYAQIEEGHYKAQDETYYQRRLQNVSQKGIISKISIASLLHVPILQFISPSISIKYKHLSSVGSTINKKIENYGVNHVMVELSIEVKMNLTMTYPFFEQYHSHTITIPVLLEIFQGQVPLVYTQ